MKKFFVVLIKSILFFCGWIVIALIEVPSDNPAIWRFWSELMPLIGIIIASVLFWFIEKRDIEILSCHNIPKSIVTGLGLGLFWFFAVLGIMYLTGVITFSGSNHTTYLGLWILSTFLNAITQELLVRGYLYQLIKTNYGIVISTVVTTALFTVFHGGAIEAGIIPVLNVVTMSLFVTALLEYTGSLIAPILVHSIWNILGAIIFGGVSLADDYPHLLNAEFHGNTLLSGGDCKIEGSIVVLVVNVLLCAVVCILIAKRKRTKVK